MEMRQLGRVGPEVSAIGLGCMPMSGVYGTTSDEDGIAAIHRALELGITLLDTADVYGAGHNEELVGRAIRDRREQVVLATKFGNLRNAQGQFAGISGRPEYVRDACEASLRRLGVDHIDLYQQHRVDPDTPIEETVGAMAELVAEGKVRYLGLSEALAPDLHRAAAVHPISSLQSEYSLLERTVENEILDTCEQLGIGFLPFSPLVRGLLGGSLPADRALDDGDTGPPMRGWRGSSRRSPTPTDRRRAASPSPGCSAAVPGSCRSPAPSASPTCRTTPERRSSPSPATTSSGSTCSRGRSRGIATARAGGRPIGSRRRCPPDPRRA